MMFFYLACPSPVPPERSGGKGAWPSDMHALFIEDTNALFARQCIGHSCLEAHG
jgi:hypothetical protein